MKQVLIIDDDPVCRELIREILQTIDLQVLEASDGRQAMEILEHHLPDLVLLDVQMPNDSGYRILENIRSDTRISSLCVAALTAYAMQGDRERGLSAGFNDYITKPVEVSTLRARVERLLNHKRACSAHYS
jgi:CheY-like chemotaxis protein